MAVLWDILTSNKLERQYHFYHSIINKDKVSFNELWKTNYHLYLIVQKFIIELWE